MAHQQFYGPDYILTDSGDLTPRAMFIQSDGSYLREAPHNLHTVPPTYWVTAFIVGRTGSSAHVMQRVVDQIEEGNVFITTAKLHGIYRNCVSIAAPGNRNPNVVLDLAEFRARELLNDTWVGNIQINWPYFQTGYSQKERPIRCGMEFDIIAAPDRTSR
jgi:hypothetical protein